MEEKWTETERWLNQVVMKILKHVYTYYIFFMTFYIHISGVLWLRSENGLQTFFYTSLFFKQPSNMFRAIHTPSGA